MATVKDLLEIALKNKKTRTWDIDSWAFELASAEKMRVSKKYPEGIKCGTIKMKLPIEVQPLGKNCDYCLESHKMYVVAIPRELLHEMAKAEQEKIKEETT